MPATITTSAADPAAFEGALLHRLSVADYHGMIDAGLLRSDSRVELIEGVLVEKPVTRNPPHSTALGKVQDALTSIAAARALIVRVQDAITLDDSEPEPDVVLARGTRADYTSRHARPADVVLVVEVSDTTLRLDRGPRSRVYARARLPLYWIVNLPDDCVEVYGDPVGEADEATYQRQERYERGAEIVLHVDGDAIATVRVDDLLP